MNTFKKCTKCKKVKSINKFSKNQYWCKECVSGYYQKNIVKIKEQHKDYNKKHKKEARKRYQKNIKAIRKITKAYRQKNRKRLRETDKKCSQLHLISWLNTPGTILYRANKKAVCAICGKISAYGIGKKEMALHRSWNCEIERNPINFLGRKYATTKNIKKFNYCHFSFLCSLSKNNCNSRLYFLKGCSQYSLEPLRYITRRIKEAIKYQTISIEKKKFLHSNSNFIFNRYKHDKSRGYLKYWLLHKTRLYGIIPQCMICNKKLKYYSRNVKERVTFDHTKKCFIVKNPSVRNWLCRHAPNEKNYNIFKSCNFGILCLQCNILAGSYENRSEWLNKALTFCLKQKKILEKV